jgi:phage tail tube protein FII
MPAIPLLLVRGINIFAEGVNTGLALESAKLPMQQDGAETFAPAAANGSIEIAVSSEALELSFKTKGVQPELLAQTNRGFGRRGKYTLYGALVDEYANDPGSRVTQVEATVLGRLNAELDEHQANALAGTGYTVKSILKYSLRIGGIEICRFDLRLGGWLDREGQRVEIAQAIGLST